MLDAGNILKFGTSFVAAKHCMNSNQLVLLVDDDKDLLEMVSLALEIKQVNVSAITDVAQLLPTIRSSKPGLILMDIYLGDKDGREICRQIKSDEEFQQIPVILYSAGNIDQQSILDSKANVFIKKPFDLANLYQTIQGLLAGNSSN